MTDLGQEQHVGNHAAHAVQLFCARLQNLPVLGKRSFSGQGNLGLAHQVGKRCSKFVSKVVRKLRELLNPIIQASQHDVDAVGEHFEFCRHPISWKAMVEALG
ncbi:hypothetical protein D3C78_1198440 [compost metagenome]